MKQEDKNLKAPAELNEDELNDVTGGAFGVMPFHTGMTTGSSALRNPSSLNAHSLQQPGASNAVAQTLQNAISPAAGSLNAQKKSSGSNTI